MDFFFLKFAKVVLFIKKQNKREGGGFISQESTKRDEVVAAAANDRYTCVKIQGHLVSEKKLPSVLAVIITLASNEKKSKRLPGSILPASQHSFLFKKKYNIKNK